MATARKAVMYDHVDVFFDVRVAYLHHSVCDTVHTNLRSASLIRLTTYHNWFTAKCPLFS